MKRSSVFVLVISLVALHTTLSCKKIEAYDVVLKNGTVYNVKTGEFSQENIGISREKIVQISSDHLEGKSVIDCSGRYIYPGFIDAHCHFKTYAEGLSTVNLIGTKSYQDVLERVSAYNRANPDVDFIIGRGWDQNDWEDKVLPTNSLLNEYFPEIPVFLERIDGHAALVNTVCINRVGFLPKEIEGGMIVMKNGEPTGLLIDNAISLIELPKVDEVKLLELLKLAEYNCLEAGLTGLVDAGLPYTDLIKLQEIYQNQELSMPTYAMVADDPEDITSLIDNGIINDDRFQVSAIKVYADGALGSRGALLTHPYHDDEDNFGLQLKQFNDLLEVCQLAKENNLQINVHAIGDSANKMVLKAFSSVLEPDNDNRWRIEHAQVILPEDSAIWGTYNIIPSVQPTHATSDMYWADERLGNDRLENAYAYKRLKRWANDKLALGTDFPVEEIDPLKTFFAAAIRKDAQNYPEDGFQTIDGLSREETIYGMTLGAAFSVFKENETGSIDIGKWADIVILDTDLINCNEEEILSANVTNTIVRGDVLYSRK